MKSSILSLATVIAERERERGRDATHTGRVLYTHATSRQLDTFEIVKLVAQIDTLLLLVKNSINLLCVDHKA